jgi:hypothetical protein
MEVLGGLYEPWGSMGNPALWFMVGMIVLPMVIAWMVARGEIDKKDKTYK